MTPSVVVYYLRHGGYIKIGHTTALVSRLRALRPDELLAVEPGGYELETQRHQQFAATHAGGGTSPASTMTGPR